MTARATFTQDDATRIFKAAKAAGYPSVRVVWHGDHPEFIVSDSELVEADQGGPNLDRLIESEEAETR